MSVYSASKAVLRSLARTLSAELVARGIRVNPGPIETPIFSRLGLPPEAQEAMAAAFTERVPLEWFGAAEEVANAVLFLASPESSYVLCAELVVDGGMTQLQTTRRMTMHEVMVDRVIDVSADRAWAIIDDFGGIYRFHPFVERSPIQNAVESGLGAERVCHFHDGNQITEQIIDYTEGESYDVEITNPGNFPLVTGIARLTVEPLASTKSRVSFRMAFKPKFGPLGWVMGKTVMTRQCRKILGQVLSGLEQHAKTGEVVSRKPRPAAAA
jgi:hypothetical protein